MNDIYKCNVCGNIVEVLTVGGGELVCCGKPMEKLEVKTKDEGEEKHKPVIKADKIEVGSVPHPMEEKHFIEWIETDDGDVKCKKFLKPSDSPAAEFKNAKSARAYCNLHGLWGSKL